MGAINQSKWASWGIDTGLTAQEVVAGVVTDFEDSSEPVLAPEQNEVGSTINQTMYDKHFTCSFTVQVKKGVAKPKAGDSITVANKSWYVTSARITENNTSYRKIAVTAERYVHCTATEVASGISSSAD